MKSLITLTSDEQKPTRDGYGQGLLEIGEKDLRVVALCADLTESTQTQLFAKKFPERFIEMGVALMISLTGEAVGGIGKILTPLPSRPCRDGSFAFWPCLFLLMNPEIPD